AFNCEASYTWEVPHTTHGWIIGCTGGTNGTKFGGAAAEYVSYGTHVSPTALYRAQLIDRVGAAQASLLGATTIGSTDNGHGGSGSGDFSISATPSSQTVVAGSPASYGVTISAQNGFSGSVGLTVSGLPAGASASFSPSSVSGSGSS